MLVFIFACSYLSIRKSSRVALFSATPTHKRIPLFLGYVHSSVHTLSIPYTLFLGKAAGLGALHIHFQVFLLLPSAFCLAFLTHEVLATCECKVQAFRAICSFRRRSGRCRATWRLGFSGSQQSVALVFCICKVIIFCFWCFCCSTCSSLSR